MLSREKFKLNPKELGFALKAWRNKLGLSQTALGARYGVRRESIRFYEIGSHQIGGWTLLKMMADGFLDDD